MILNPELFYICREDGVIIFNPLNHVKMKVSFKLVEYLREGHFFLIEGEVINRLKKVGMLLDGLPPAPTIKRLGYKPTHVTILPSFECNLRCVYCYSQAGDDFGRKIDMKIWKAAADFVINNALDKGSDQASLSFHGGGEPLLPKNFPSIKEVVAYFRKRCKLNNLKSRVGVTTNGVVDPVYHKVVAELFDYVCFSIDGDADTHRAQRPAADGSDSYAALSKTVKALRNMGVYFSFRTTVSPGGAMKLSDFVREFHEKFKVKKVHFEPLFECGRCHVTGAESPEQRKFIKGYVAAKKVADELGMTLIYSGDRFDVTSIFCGAAGTNFFLNPEGYITMCLEVCRKSDNNSDIFFVGHYDSESCEFVFDEKRIEYLQSRNVMNLPDCADCIAKYACAGACLAKVLLEKGDIYKTEGNWACPVNKTMMINQIIAEVESA